MQTHRYRMPLMAKHILRSVRVPDILQGGGIPHMVGGQSEEIRAVRIRGVEN